MEIQHLCMKPSLLMTLLILSDLLVLAPFSLAKESGVEKTKFPLRTVVSSVHSRGFHKGKLSETALSSPSTQLRRLSKRSGISPPSSHKHQQLGSSKNNISDLVLTPQQSSSNSTLLIKPPVLEPTILPKKTATVVRELSLLDILFDNEEEFWTIINITYNEVCKPKTQCEEPRVLHGGQTGLCPRCWCDSACLLYGDCCPAFYMKNGYTPPLPSTVQECRKASFPDTDLQQDSYRMIWSCADRRRIADLKNFPIKSNSSRDDDDDEEDDVDGDSTNINNSIKKSQSLTPASAMSEAERMCMNPDPSAHWNQTRPITDLDTGLTFASQYCAQCSGVGLLNSLPWKLSINVVSNRLFTEARSVLETYVYAVTSGDAQVVYKPPLANQDHARKCRNTEDDTRLVGHVSRCNQTGLWKHYSLTADRACAMLNLPIITTPRKYSYQNLYCYYCNHDVTWKQVTLLAGASPSKITGIGDNILSVLLDLDGSDEKKFTTSVKDVNPSLDRKCNSSHFYDLVKDKCREVRCAPGKLPGEDQTCRGNPDMQSNAFGYTACYLVSGLAGGSNSVTDLAGRLAEQPYMVRRFGSNPTVTDANQTAGPDYETRLSETLNPIVVKTSRWTCNSCGLLDQTSHSAALLIQVAWASQSVLNRNQTEQLLINAQTPLVDLLAVTVSAVPDSAFYMGNLTAVKYPYCHIEDNPAPSRSFMGFLPPPRHSEQQIAPVPCIGKVGVANQTKCAIDVKPRVKFPPQIFTQGGALKNYVNLIEYLPVNNLLTCQFVEVAMEEYSFNIQDWTVHLNHCDTDISAQDVTISETDGTMYVCLKDYACWTRSQHLHDKETIHDAILRWISLVCTLLSMLCCLATFLTYSCLPQLRSSAGINNMVLAFTVFCAQGLAQFGSSQKDRYDVCVIIGVLTHFFWLAAVAAMSTATFHMFYALSFPLHFQQYHGRESVLLRVYVSVVLLIPAVFIACTILYGLAVNGGYSYAGGSNCFVDAGLPKIMFFGVPVLLLVLANVGMYIFTVARLHGTPKIGDTKIQRSNTVLYSKLSVATGMFWLFGFLYDLTELVVFAYAFMLTAPLLGLFLLLAFVANKRVLEMAKTKFPAICANLIPAGGENSASRTTGSTLKKTKSTAAE